MIGPISYLQGDSRWGKNNYSAPGENKTISSSGCGPTCMAMVLASLVKTGMTPVQTAKWSMAHGYKYLNQGTAYAYFAAMGKEYGLLVEQLNFSTAYGNTGAEVHTRAKKALKAGDWLICCMGPGNWTSGGHYILVYAIDGNKVYINDPASKAANRVESTFEKLKKEVKYYFHVHIPEYIVNTKKNPLGCYVEQSTKAKRICRYKKGSQIKLVRLCNDTWAVYTDGKYRGYSRRKFTKKK